MFGNINMKTLKAAFVVGLLAVSPAFAGGIGLDLPHLTWPEAPAAPTDAATRGCADQTAPGSVACPAQG